jgi:FtsP/CotA-like multicopper oxidase with cupredoxin domain
MLAYNGSVPSPTLQVEQGRDHRAHPEDGDIATTVHWHGLRPEHRYDGVRHETQQPIPVGGCYSCQVQFPRRRLPLVSPAHQGRTSLRRWASMEPIVVEPTDAAYWPDVDCQLTMSWTNLLVERGHIVPFHQSGRPSRR